MCPINFADVVLCTFSDVELRFVQTIIIMYFNIAASTLIFHADFVVKSSSFSDNNSSDTININIKE
jgi:hypothetical protein